MLHLCERALPFSCLQFEIKQKIKEVIEKKYNLLDEGVKNKSWDTAEYLKQLAQFSTRIGATRLAINLNDLEEAYRPNPVIAEAFEKVEV